MSRKDWVFAGYSCWIDPTADKNCPVCNGRGILRHSTGFKFECFNCIEDLSKESILAAVDYKLQAAPDLVGKYDKRLWEEAGQPVGQDEEFWLKAEEELRRASSPKD